VSTLAPGTTAVPDQENAYPILLRIQAQCPTDPDEDLEWVFEKTPDGGRPAPAEWQERAAESLRRRQETLGLAHEMVDRPYFAPPLGDRPPGLLEWPEEARATVRSLMVESAVELSAGQPAEALGIACRAVEFGVKMAEGSDSLMTSLVGLAVRAVGLHQVRTVALSSSIDAGTAVAALASLELDDRVVEGMRRALRAEYRCTDLMMAGMARVEDTESVPGARTARLLFRRVPIMKPGMVHNLLGDVVAGALARTEGYTPTPPEAFQPASVADRVDRTHLLLDPVGSILVLMLEPALHGTVDAHFKVLAELRMTRLLLALRAYELEQGALPNSLEDLVPRYLPRLPQDPFTEQPFVYDLQVDTPCLRSAGPDGQVDRRSPEEGGDDVSVELRLPEPKPPATSMPGLPQGNAAPPRPASSSTIP
jgi:hypothetical protein